MKAYTPGPWKVVDTNNSGGSYGIDSVDPSEFYVAETIGGMHEDMEQANAQLIATSPEMAEALESAQQLLNILRLTYNVGEILDKVEKEFLETVDNKIKIVLAKAGVTR